MKQETLTKTIVLLSALLLLSFGGYFAYQSMYLEYSNVWYLDKHFGHPDEINKILVGVRGVTFGDSTFYGGASSKETFGNKIQTAKKLFEKHQLLQQINVKEYQEINEVVITIIRNVPNEPTRQIRISVKSDRLNYNLSSGIVGAWGYPEEAISFTEKLRRVEEAAIGHEVEGVKFHGLLKKAGIDIEDGISEFKILLRK